MSDEIKKLQEKLDWLWSQDGSVHAIRYEAECVRNEIAILKGMAA
jgi:hypothetical protein